MRNVPLAWSGEQPNGNCDPLNCRLPQRNGIVQIRSGQPFCVIGPVALFINRTQAIVAATQPALPLSFEGQCVHARAEQPSLNLISIRRLSAAHSCSHVSILCTISGWIEEAWTCATRCGDSLVRQGIKGRRLGNEKVNGFIAGHSLEIQHGNEKSCRHAVCTAKEAL